MLFALLCYCCLPAAREKIERAYIMIFHLLVYMGQPFPPPPCPRARATCNGRCAALGGASVTCNRRGTIPEGPALVWWWLDRYVPCNVRAHLLVVSMCVRLCAHTHSGALPCMPNRSESPTWASAPLAHHHKGCPKHGVKLPSQYKAMQCMEWSSLASARPHHPFPYRGVINPLITLLV